jgi:ABC-type transport system involved in multi-copper enzyme maturation permease subunit
MARIALNLNPINPVALREMRARMRGPRAFILLGLYLGLLALLLYAVYIRSGGGSTYTYGGYSGTANFGPTRSFEIGQNLFITVFFFLTIFVALITPAITGGVVSRELEGRTYELLMITPVRSRSVVFGKLFAALSFVFFMIASALPMACIVFIFGGVDSQDILIGFAVVLMAAVTYGAMGLFFSALVKRTGPAVILTYALVALMLVGSWQISNNIAANLSSEQSRLPSGAPRVDPRIDPAYDLPKRLLVVNPIAAVGSILAPNAPYRSSNVDELQLFPNSKFFGGSPNNYYANSSGSPQVNALARQPVLPGGLPLWAGYILVYTGLSLLFFLLSLTVVKPGLRPRVPSIRLPAKGKSSANAQVALKTRPEKSKAKFKFGGKKASKVEAETPAVKNENPEPVAAPVTEPETPPPSPGPVALG